jgi:hypothetical protein
MLSLEDLWTARWGSVPSFQWPLVNLGFDPNIGPQKPHLGQALTENYLSTLWGNVEQTPTTGWPDAVKHLGVRIGGIK